VSPGGLSGAGSITCSTSASGQIAISIANSPDYNVDGLTISGCGSSSAGAISMQDTAICSLVNGTLICNNVILNSVGVGIFKSMTYKSIVYVNHVSLSGTSGIQLTGCNGAIVSQIVVMSSTSNGVLVDYASTTLVCVFYSYIS
jgi:hypothetical protein